MDEELLTLHEVAKWLRVSWHTAYRMAPHLGASKVRGQLRIPAANVRTYIDEHTIPARDDTRSQ